MPNTETATTSQNKEERNHTSPDKGTAYYPISDLQFDVVTLIFEKSKALQAYDKYIRDAKECEALSAIFEQIKMDDK